MTTNCDVVVIGAGLIGLATARAILTATKHEDVFEFEKENAIASHQSGHNERGYPFGRLLQTRIAESRLLRGGGSTITRVLCSSSNRDRTVR